MEWEFGIHTRKLPYIKQKTNKVPFHYGLSQDIDYSSLCLRALVL